MSKNNPIVLKKNSGIGKISAEADHEFLYNCFVDHVALSAIDDADNPQMILLGPTGSGKTAVMKMLARKHERNHELDLDDLSLSYLANSDVIAFLLALDVSLDHFFQALWRHVICLEYIKPRFNVDSEGKSKNLWARIKERFSGQAPKQRAMSYLEKWENKFWISYDESVREITKNLEEDVTAIFAADIEKFKTDVGYRRKLSHDRKSHLQQRLKQFVNADLLTELSQVINLLSEYEPDSKVVNFVILDRLDENWIDGAVKYQLVRALIEALKSLRRMSDLKVAVALRSDLMEKIIYETRDLGFQSEKYEDYVQRLTWTADDLKVLVNKRINYLFRRKYNSENVFFESIFTDSVGRDKSFAYILDRTLYRPRDVITFINLYLEQAAGKNEVKKSDIQAAERVYSENRRQALIDEWRPVFPGIEPSIEVLNERRRFFSVYEWSTSDFVSKLMSLFYEKDSYQSDPICRLLEKATEVGGDSDALKIAAVLLERLHLVGAVGLNTHPDQPVHWFYKNQRRVDSSSIKVDTRVRIHPMLYSSLNISS